MKRRMETTSRTKAEIYKRENIIETTQVQKKKVTRGYPKMKDYAHMVKNATSRNVVAVGIDTKAKTKQTETRKKGKNKRKIVVKNYVKMEKSATTTNKDGVGTDTQRKMQQIRAEKGKRKNRKMGERKKENKHKEEKMTGGTTYQSTRIE